MKTSPQENFRTLNLFLLICNSLINSSLKGRSSQGFWLPQNVDTEDCIRQKLVHLLILSKVYSKYDIKRIPQSIFFQPFAIIFQSQHTYSGQAQLSHPRAALPQLQEPPSRGRSDTALRPGLSRVWELSTRQDCHWHQSATAHKVLPHLQGHMAMLHLMPSSIISLLLPDFFSKLKLMSPHCCMYFYHSPPAPALKWFFKTH